MRQNGQSILEYAVITACIIAALVAMRIYIKRGISGGLKSAADQLGEQYDPGNTESDITIEQSSDIVTTVTTIDADNDTLKTESITTINNQLERRYGTEEVGSAANKSIWD
jgi:Flp pilus assembly pilin Flp